MVLVGKKTVKTGTKQVCLNREERFNAGIAAVSFDEWVIEPSSLVRSLERSGGKAGEVCQNTEEIYVMCHEGGTLTRDERDAAYSVVGKILDLGEEGGCITLEGGEIPMFDRIVKEFAKPGKVCRTEIICEDYP